MMPIPLFLTVRMISRRLSISETEKERGRLVEDDHPPLEHEALGDLDRLLLAAGQLPIVISGSRWLFR